jgi:DNA (cytosine-5)-methyltransferase 1
VSLRVLDLFSGIGGFSLGLERAGMKTVAFCEIDPFCRRVLNKHWPDVPIYEDVKTLTAERLRAAGIAVDVICGGFPCQDISEAGERAGLDGEESRLWFEYSRLIGEIRPRYVFVENVAALLGRGLSTVLGDLAALGFDAEWHCIPACAVGAPHERDRIWIVAYPSGIGCGPRRPWRLADGLSWISDAPRWDPTDTNRQPAIGSAVSWSQHSAWPDEPALLGMDDGVPDRMDRVRVLGNAVVPGIPEATAKAALIAASTTYLQAAE